MSYTQIHKLDQFALDYFIPELKKKKDILGLNEEQIHEICIKFGGRLYFNTNSTKEGMEKFADDFIEDLLKKKMQIDTNDIPKNEVKNEKLEEYFIGDLYPSEAKAEQEAISNFPAPDYIPPPLSSFTHFAPTFVLSNKQSF